MNTARWQKRDPCLTRCFEERTKNDVKAGAVDFQATPLPNGVLLVQSAKTSSAAVSLRLPMLSAKWKVLLNGRQLGLEDQGIVMSDEAFDSSIVGQVFTGA